MCRAWSWNALSAEPSSWIVAAVGLSGALAVLLGAFGAHGLAERLTPDQEAIWATANQYHFVHTLALALGAALLRGDANRRLLQGLCAAWVAGIVLFSGTLYLLAVTGIGWLGAITPVGGVLFVAGWLALMVAGLRSRPSI